MEKIKEVMDACINSGVVVSEADLEILTENEVKRTLDYCRKKIERVNNSTVKLVHYYGMWMINDGSGHLVEVF
jgi:hypothetical protein